MFRTTELPLPRLKRTFSVASEYSPVPGTNATPRTSRAGDRATPAPGFARRNTSKLNCGIRLP
jgi:hypothetical protein